MMTSAQYRCTLDALNLNVYIQGSRVDNVLNNPVICQSIDAVARTYEMALLPEHENIMTAISHITGARINRFNHINQDLSDLAKKSILNRFFSITYGSAFGRTLGMNALNALSITTSDIDARYGTDYHARFLNYLVYVQDNDMTCHGSMKDPWRNKYLPPHKQSRPDLLLHTVEEKSDGIILQGAKVCDISALHSHELIIIPTMAMTSQDDSFALSFALPSDTQGITFVIGPESHDMTNREGSIIDFAASAFQSHEALCIFDNVFVPRERFFMYKEYEFAEQMAEFFKYSFCFEFGEHTYKDNKIALNH